MFSTLKIIVEQLPHAKNLSLPQYQTIESAGMDLHAAVDSTETINPGEFKLVPIGIKIEIPNGFEGQIRPRSGLAVKYGITVLNAPGTIDSDYRGEIKVCLINHGSEVFEITRGARIAQLVIAPIARLELVENKLKESARNEGGFGSTG